MQYYKNKTVHILYSNIKSIWNEFAFLFPIAKNKTKLKRDFNLGIKLYSDHKKPDLFDCDTLIVSCYYFGRKMKSWLNDPEEIFSFLKNAKKKETKCCLGRYL